MKSQKYPGNNSFFASLPALSEIRAASIHASLSDNNSLPILFAFNHITVALAGKTVLRDVTFRIAAGEAVAVTGRSGSGKTVLAHTIAGRHYFHGDYTVTDGPVENFQRGVQVVGQQHRFRNRNQTTDQYYQQRFNSLNATETITVADELTPYGDGAGTYSKSRLLKLFGIEDLLNQPLIQLSNGENKRLQMVKALLVPHTLLILDQPFTGLDAAGRNALSSVLLELNTAGETILLITTPRDVPDCFRRQIIMSEGQVCYDGIAGQVAYDVDRRDDENKVFKMPPGSGIGIVTSSDFDYAFRLKNVSIRYDEKVILQNINWTVKKGECWSLSGPNGAGKSTLLSLLTGDNPQAYANDVELFDRIRGTGESIWDIKKKIGLVSPELHVFFDPAATVHAVIASGLFDTIGLFRILNEAQESLVDEWLNYLGLKKISGVLLQRLPAGKQRLILLGRALIKYPPLLILDEPCQGLDGEDIELVKELVTTCCTSFGATLIFVSHYPAEWPSCIGQHAWLDKGVLTLTS